MDTSNGCDVTKLREELAATRKALRKAQACSMMEAKRLLLTLEAQSRKLKRADHDQEYLQHQVLQLQSQLSRQEAVYADRTSQTVRVLYCWFLCTLSGKDRQADQLRADAVAARRGLMQHAKYHRDHFKRRTDEYKRLFDEEVATNNAAHEAAIEEHTGASEALRRQLTELHDSHAQLQRERSELHNKHEELQGYHSHLQQQHNQLQQEHGTLHRQCEQLRAQKDGLQQQNRQQQQQNSDLQERCDQLQRDNGELQGQQDQLEQQIGELRQRCDLLQEEKQQLQEQHQELRQQADEEALLRPATPDRNPNVNIQCPICQEECTAAEAFIVTACGHQMCAECAHELVVQGVKNSEIPILCPTCKLPESACAMCERKRNEPQGSRSGPHNWCCSLDADVRRLLNEEEEHQSGSRPRHRNENTPRMVCGECGHRWCRDCNIDWHDGRTCEQEAAAAARAAFVSPVRIIHCPGCGHGIEKEAGCNKIVCSQCRTPVCWLCQAQLPPADPYSHFRQEGTPCSGRLHDNAAA